MSNWIEVNTKQDLPDKEAFCWFVNRSTSDVFCGKLKGQMFADFHEIAFSHYMPIIDIPVAPIDRKEFCFPESLTIKRGKIDITYDKATLQKMFPAIK